MNGLKGILYEGAKLKRLRAISDLVQGTKDERLMFNELAIKYQYPFYDEITPLLLDSLIRDIKRRRVACK